MRICDFLKPEHILFGVSVKSKHEAISSALNLFNNDIEPEKLSGIAAKVFEREELMSTGVGKGLAIPHAKSDLLSQHIISLVILEQGVDFKSIDGHPVDIVMLVVGPTENNRIHIQILSRISKMMNKDGFRRDLKDSTSPEEITSLFRQEELQSPEIV